MRATPRAAKEAIEGVKTDDDSRTWLAVRSAAVPSDGAANDALIRLLAKALKVRKGDVTLTSGKASRLKRLYIRGDPARLAAAMAQYDGE